MSNARGLVITGLGLVLPQGVGLASAEAVFRGRSAVVRLPDFPELPDATGAPVERFVPPAGTEESDRAVQFALAAADEAWAASGLAHGAIPPDRIATVVSLSKGGVLAMAEACLRREGLATLLDRASPAAAARAVAERLGAAGPVAAPVTACASGGHALAWAATLIDRGVVDAAIVGAAEASIHPLMLGSYRRMGVLAPPGDDPAASVRPFSATRGGFAIGEGAGMIVLEAEASADRRGATPLARLRGWACGAHASSLTDMEAGGASLARLIAEALRRSGTSPAEIDYVHAHGTATRRNDAAEAEAIRRALGEAADAVSVSSTKGAHGHLLGAATAAELVLTVLAIQRQTVPPTANLTDPDPDIRLDCTPQVARRRPVGVALKIASGFGGQMAAIVLARP